MALRMTRIQQFEIQNQKIFLQRGHSPSPQNFFGSTRPCTPICKSWIRHCLQWILYRLLQHFLQAKCSWWGQINSVKALTAQQYCCTNTNKH